MQEQRFDDSEILTPSVTPAQLAEAIENKENKTVSIHRPGTVFQTRDGIEYRVGPRGNFIRITPKRKIKPQPSSHARKRAAKKFNKENLS